MRKESFQGILLGIVIMCAVFAFITVAWATLNATLYVGGTATVTAQSWDVGFSNTTTILGVSDSVTLTGSKTGDAELPLTNPTLTKTKFGLDTTNSDAPMSLGTLTSVGDTITYTWNIVNAGTFDAEITSTTPSSTLTAGVVPLTCTGTDTQTVLDAVCAGITATLKVNNTALSSGVQIAKNSNKSISLELVYTSAPSDAANLPTAPVTVNLPSGGLQLGFSQASASSNSGD